MNSDIHARYGWYFLAEQVADFSKVSFFEILEQKAAIEVFSIVQIMQAKIQLKLNQQNNA